MPSSATVLGLLLAVPAAAGAQPALTTPPGAAGFTVAAAPTGPAAVAVWERTVAGRRVVEVSSRGAGGAWSSPVVVARDATAPETLRLAASVNARGEVLVMWLRRGARVQQMIVAVRAASGRWGAPRVLVRGPRIGWADGSLAADGTAAIGWGDTRGLRTPTPVRVSVRRPGGAFGPFRVVGRSDPASQPLADLQVRALPGAGAAVSWGDLLRTVVVRYRAGRWGAPLTIPVVEGGWPTVLSPQGAAYVIWFARSRGGASSEDAVEGRVMASVAPPGRGWTPPRSISGPPAAIAVDDIFFLGTDLTIDAAGRPFAAWRRYPRFPGATTRAAVVAATGGPAGWGTGRVVSGAGTDALAIDVEGGSRGALLAWIEAVPGEGNDRIRATHSGRVGARWDPPRALFGGTPAAEFDPLAVTAIAGPGRAGAAVRDRNRPGDSPIAFRAGAGGAWGLVSSADTGAFGAQQPLTVHFTADGAAYAEVERYPTAAYAERERTVLLVPVPPAAG